MRNPGREDALELRNTDLVACAPGDVIRVTGPGAGGWGDPFARNSEAVRRDVAQGAVSEESARSHYGVVLRDGAVDNAATEALRGERPAPARSTFSFAAERQAFEQVWSPERYALLTEFLADVPLGWRFFLKHRIFDRVEAEGTEADMATQMATIFRDLRERYAL